jgi:hypothetical protein
MAPQTLNRNYSNSGHSGFVMSPNYQYDGLISPRSKGATYEDTKSNYGYAPKSRILYSRKGLGSAQAKRSKTNTRMSAAKGMRNETMSPYVDERSQGYNQVETKSRLNDKIMKRFNETPSIDGDRKSQARSIFSKAKSQVPSKLA